MAPNPTITARTPEDLLAAVPLLLGFHPEESVVVVTTGAARDPFHARIDLPQDPVALEEMAGYLSAVTERSRVRQVALVAYTPDAGLAEAAADAFSRGLEAVGAELVCALRAADHRWWVLGVNGGRGGPDGLDGPGTPYDVSTHRFLAQHVLDGEVVLASRRELAATLVGSDVDQQDRVGVAATRLASDLVTSSGSPSRTRLETEATWVRSRVRRFLEDGRWLGEHDVARLAVAVTVSRALRGSALSRLDRSTAARQVDLWRDVVRRVPADVRAAPATMCGFSAWVAGNGALAWCALDLARASGPTPDEARLLADALEGGVPPSVWQPAAGDPLTGLGG